MSEIVRLRSQAQVDEEAALWIWRLDSGPDDAADPEVFEAWLRQDPRHRRAIEELSNVWNALDGFADAKRQEKVETFIDVANIAPRRDRHARWLAAAAVLVAAIAAIAWLRPDSGPQVLVTAVGQHRNVTLADGSTVALNTNTVVETLLGRRVRQIYLRKGEAHFQVVHDGSRPFLVHAGDAVVRAVGTQFEVRVHPDHHVDVVVNEGRVEVRASPSQSGSADARAPGIAGLPEAAVAMQAVRAVSAGEQLSTASTDFAVKAVTPAQLSSELAWREGAIILDSEPLSAAVAEIERYTDARIVISDPRVAALRVGGRFRTDDVQGFLDGLQEALPVTIRRNKDGQVYVDPR